MTSPSEEKELSDLNARAAWREVLHEVIFEAETPQQGQSPDGGYVATARNTILAARARIGRDFLVQR